MPAGRHGRQRLDRVREPHVHRRGVGGGGPRRARRSAPAAPPARPRPAGRGASWPASSPRRCSAGSWWCSTSPRSRWRATTCCPPCWSPTPSSSTTGPASPTGRGARSATPAAAAPVPCAGRRWPALVLVTGTLVTGSGPHGGDEAADRLPFAVVTVARVHSADRRGCSSPSSLVVLRQRQRGRRRRPSVVGRGRVLVGAIVAQGTLGYVQYVAGVPEAARRPPTCSAPCSCGWPCCGSTSPSPSPSPTPASPRRPPTRPASPPRSRRDGRPRPVAGRGRRAGRRHPHRARRPVDRPRVERPDQPHVLRHLRAPEALRLPEGEGRPR